MGCGASSPADPLDSNAALAPARKRTSTAITVAAKAPEEDNPFLDPEPGIDEHRKAIAARSASASDPGDAALIQPIKASGRSASTRHLPQVPQVPKELDDEKQRDEADESPKPDPPGAKVKTLHARRASRTAREEEKTPLDASPTSADDPSIETTTLPDVQASPHGSRIPLLTRTTSFTELILSSPPSLNLSDPSRLTTQLTSTFLHYAHKLYDPSPPSPQPSDEDERLDKKALHQLAYDCVLSFMISLRAAMQKHKESVRRKEEDFARRQMLPGDTVDEVMDTARDYLKAELVYKSGQVTKTCFFFHFPRAFRSMFVYEKISLERENLVVKWNKLCKERQQQAPPDPSSAPHNKSADSAERDKKKDKKSGKTTRRNKKDRKTVPSEDLMANMAGHGSKLLQAEKKLKSAHKAGQGGSTRNLLRDEEEEE